MVVYFLSLFSVPHVFVRYGLSSIFSIVILGVSLIFVQLSTDSTYLLSFDTCLLYFLFIVLSAVSSFTLSSFTYFVIMFLYIVLQNAATSSFGFIPFNSFPSSPCIFFCCLFLVFLLYPLSGF